MADISPVLYEAFQAELQKIAAASNPEFVEFEKVARAHISDWDDLPIEAQIYLFEKRANWASKLWGAVTGGGSRVAQEATKAVPGRGTSRLLSGSQFTGAKPPVRATPAAPASGTPPATPMTPPAAAPVTAAAPPAAGRGRALRYKNTATGGWHDSPDAARKGLEQHLLSRGLAPDVVAQRVAAFKPVGALS